MAKKPKKNKFNIDDWFYIIFEQKDLDRFWSKVDDTPGLGPDGDCWEFRTSQNAGYPTFGMKDLRKNKRVSFAHHRVAYFVNYGPFYNNLSSAP